MVRWNRWKGQTNLARAWSVGPMDGSNQSGTGMVRWTDARVKPSWRTAWSVGADDEVGQPAPWFWWVVGRLTRSGSREFKGRPRDNKTIGSVRPRLPFSSINRQSLNRRSWCSPGHSPKHPTCWVRRGLASVPGLTGPWPVKDQLKTNLSVPCNSAEFFSERNFPSAVEQPVVTVYRCL